MRYQVLYRTYRPSKFSEVIGQEHIIKTLQNAIKSDKIAHAYLFAGPRGTGKTTIAKIFAKAVNCPGFISEPCDECETCVAINQGTNPDVLELDAASNNGVDNIRQIITEVAYPPTTSKYKVYIIDEVHMLSTGAFNALLKTLEEPPAHVIFILATTDPQKVLPTVISRCQRFNFSKLTKYEIVTKLIEILNKENIAYEDEALKEIATLADGGMRDALSILEEVLSYSDKDVTLEDVEKIFGLTSTKELVQIFVQATNDEKTKVVKKLREMYKAGRDLKRLATDLLIILKEALIYSDGNDESLLEKISKEDAEEILKLVETNKIAKDIEIIQSVLKDLTYSGESLSYMELALIKMGSTNFSTEQVIEIAKKTQEEYKEDAAKKVIEDDGYDIDTIAKLLCIATKEEKITDSIVYNTLKMYEFDTQYRRYYELLSKTTLFASCREALIIKAPRDIASAINDDEINRGIYEFFLHKHGLDKMAIAFDQNISKQIIDRFNYFSKTPHDPVFIKKHELKKEKTQDEKIDEVFGEHH